MIIISWGPKTKQPKKKKSEEEKTHFRKSILMDDFHLCSFLSQKLLLFFPLCDRTTVQQMVLNFQNPSIKRLNLISYIS